VSTTIHEHVRAPASGMHLAPSDGVSPTHPTEGGLPMRQIICRAFAATLFATAGFTVAACHHHHYRNEGPAQHAGRHVDHAADKAGDAIEDAGRKVNRALPGD